MKFFQFTGEGVGVRGGKGVGGASSLSRSAVILASRLVGSLAPAAALIHQPPHGVQCVQRPAPLRDGNFLERFDATKRPLRPARCWIKLWS